MVDPSKLLDREVVAKIIDMARRTPALWQVDSPAYKNRNAKFNGYDDISRALMDKIPGLTAQCIRMKWNSLKSCYLRERRRVREAIRSGAAETDNVKPQLWYFDRMTFLDDCMEPATSMENVEKDDSVVTQDDLFITDETQQQQSVTRIPRRRRTPFIRTPVMKRPYERIQSPSRHEAYGRALAQELDSVPNDQQIFAKKLIAEVLFLSQVGRLTEQHSVCLPMQVSAMPTWQHAAPPLPQNPPIKQEGHCSTPVPAYSYSNSSAVCPPHHEDHSLSFQDS